MSESNMCNFDFEVYDQDEDPSKYKKVRERVKSFVSPSWKKIFIDTLYWSKAGFYFFESPDRLKCFSCNIVLSDWNITDDPWIEHAFWNPSCQHVRDIKGDDFISDINRKWRREFSL